MLSKSRSAFEAVPAEVEEVVLDRGDRDAQDLGPELRQPPLRRGGGRHVPRAPDRGLRLPGEGLLVDLAVRRDRQGVEQLDPGGDQVPRQHVAQPRRDRRRRGPLLCRHDEGDEADVLRGSDRDHGRRAHVRQGFEGDLHFLRLDPEAADLHLCVAAVEVFDGAVLRHPADVPGMVAPAPGRRAEARVGEVRPVPVAGGETVAARDELPATPRGSTRPAGSTMASDVPAIGRPMGTDVASAGQGRGDRWNAGEGRVSAAVAVRIAPRAGPLGPADVLTLSVCPTRRSSSPRRTSRPVHDGVEERRGEPHRRAPSSAAGARQLRHAGALDHGQLAPLRSAPHISKVEASNTGVERKGTTRVGRRAARSRIDHQPRDGVARNDDAFGFPVEPEVT